MTAFGSQRRNLLVALCSDVYQVGVRFLTLGTDDCDSRALVDKGRGHALDAHNTFNGVDFLELEHALVVCQSSLDELVAETLDDRHTAKLCVDSLFVHGNFRIKEEITTTGFVLVVV